MAAKVGGWRGLRGREEWSGRLMDCPLAAKLARRLRPCLALAGLFLLTACDQGPEVLEISGPAQGTSYSIQVVAPPAGLDEKELRTLAEDELGAVDRLLSTWRDDSELARFNAASATEWFPVSQELAALVGRSLAIGRETRHAFDITLAPLLELWGFGPRADTTPSLPAADALEAARARVGPGQIEVRARPPALRKKRADVVVELDGIAQGYTVDRLAAALDERGASRYLVELGGELFGRGRNPEGQPWTIGIEKPVAGVRRLHRMVTLDGVGMTTSGDYRVFFEIEGKRYSHTLDPRTGRPVRHALRSVTVIADSAARADALATALMVLGPDEGRAYASDRGIAALFIVGGDGGYTDHATPPFHEFLSRGKTQ